MFKFIRMWNCILKLCDSFQKGEGARLGSQHRYDAQVGERPAGPIGAFRLLLGP
jgi:hypothetical protein